MNNIAETISYFENKSKTNEIAIYAIKKQIGMRVRREQGFYGPIPYCPVCNNKLTEWASKMLCDNYCRNCGQKLDWSEDPKWFTPFEKMPNIGDKIVVQDWSGEEMEIVFESFPTDINQSNVCKWRYTE